MISIQGKFICISFAYDSGLIDIVKSIPGRVWVPADKVWKVPATPYHASEVKRQLSPYIRISPSIDKLIQDGAFSRETADPEPYAVNGFKPYPFQAVAIPFLDSVNGRGLLCDEVGLGKTCESLIYARYKKCETILIVTPASVVYKWENEVHNWLPGISIQIIPDSKTLLACRRLIMSWTMMSHRLEELSKVDWDMVILDEFHAIKSHKAIRTRAARIICRRAKYIVGLSGTPLLNKPAELYNMLNILDPDAWSFPSYMKRYCFDGMGYGAALHLDELERRIFPVMLRRYKKDISSLPRITRTFVPVEVNTVDYYKVFREDHKTLTRLFGKAYFSIDLEWIMALKQVIERAKAAVASEWAKDFLESTDKKLVIYCSYLYTIGYLEQDLMQYKVVKIVGDMGQKERADVIQRWQTTPNERVMLLTSAGGQGIDLFGLNGMDISTLLFVGREWNPAVEEQIEGRLDRTGQTFPVQAVYLLARDTIDVKVNDLVNTKREMIRQVVGIREIPTVEADLLTFLEKVGGYKRKINNAKSKSR